MFGRSASQQQLNLCRNAIIRRRSGDLAMDAKVGPETVLSRGELDELEVILLWAGRNDLAVGRSQLKEAREQAAGRPPSP